MEKKVNKGWIMVGIGIGMVSFYLIPTIITWFIRLLNLQLKVSSYTISPFIILIAGILCSNLDNKRIKYIGLGIITFIILGFIFMGLAYL